MPRTHFHSQAVTYNRLKLKPTIYNQVPLFHGLPWLHMSAINLMTECFISSSSQPKYPSIQYILSQAHFSRPDTFSRYQGLNVQALIPQSFFYPLLPSLSYPCISFFYLCHLAILPTQGFHNFLFLYHTIRQDSLSVTLCSKPHHISWSFHVKVLQNSCTLFFTSSFAFMENKNLR